MLSAEYLPKCLAMSFVHFRSDAQFGALALGMMVLETNARATHDSLQVIPLDSEFHETIRKTTRASQVKPETNQQNEPDSLQKKRGSHL